MSVCFYIKLEKNRKNIRKRTLIESIFSLLIQIQIVDLIAWFKHSSCEKQEFDEFINICKELVFQGNCINLELLHFQEQLQ